MKSTIRQDLYWKVADFAEYLHAELIKALSQRNTVYNKTMELIEKLEDEGRIRVIRPVNPVEVGRMEKDTDKLRALYQEGYAEAERMLLFI